MRNNWFVFVFVYCCCCSIYRYKLKITFSPRFLLLLAKQLIAYAYSLIPMWKAAARVIDYRDRDLKAYCNRNFKIKYARF